MTKVPRNEFLQFIASLDTGCLSATSSVERLFPQHFRDATDEYGYAFLHYIARSTRFSSATHVVQPPILKPFEFALTTTNTFSPEALRADVANVLLESDVYVNPCMASLLRAGYTLHASAQSTVFSHTPLHVAAAENHSSMLLAIIEYMISNAPDFEAKYRDTTPRTIPESDITADLKRYAVPMETIPPPLNMHNLPSFSLSLIRAWLDMRDSNSYSPLDFACEEGSVQCAAILLSFGANPDSTNEHGHTALMLAAEEGHAAIVTLLCSFAMWHVQEGESS